MHKQTRFTPYFLLIFGILVSNCVLSQTLITKTERNYHLNVKQFNEFVDRFNYKTDFKGNKIDSTFKSKISREKYLDLLFNVEDSRLIQNDLNYSDAYAKLKNEFVHEVVTNDCFIDKYSVKIIAEAKSQVTYNNNPVEVCVFLNQEIIDNGVKWVLLSVKADFLNVLKQDTVLLRFIPPTSNETNFISLKRAFDDKSYQHYYSYHGYTFDPLSAFLFAVNNGSIQFQYVNEIVYHILDIPGWKIKIKEFNRNTENSGWLIDDIYRIESSFEELLEELIEY